MAGLSISRRPGQTVVIESPGFAMVINVQETSRTKVHLNFLGPAEVKVYRGELFGAIKGFDVYDRLVVECKDAGDAGDVGDESVKGVKGVNGDLAGQLNMFEEGTDAVETADR